MKLEKYDCKIKEGKIWVRLPAHARKRVLCPMSDDEFFKRADEFTARKKKEET